MRHIGSGIDEAKVIPGISPASIPASPSRGQVTYFAIAFSVLFFGFSAFGGRPWLQSLVLGPTCSLLSLAPWFVHLRRSGRGEGIAAWSIPMGAFLVQAGDRPILDLLARLLALTAANLALAAIFAAFPPSARKPRKPPGRSLWDAQVDGPS